MKKSENKAQKVVFPVQEGFPEKWNMGEKTKNLPQFRFGGIDNNLN
ncbi:hypothetical protein I5M27_10685 [Adhaeribacter sp. BT258]|uniref:Uncharacterized protein n=1 Tax=Adhaeribacter terrigena TaxID=2793070 RepID=A0ABS1C231_9BACT|nr:hypothetical protein [Adhaeribacter terrigena]MBK0403452.1 hypothetical protein [Adhaeribacter terrigena]